MARRQPRSGTIAVAIGLLGVLITACGGGSSSHSGGTSSNGKLIGLFKIDPGMCTTAGVTSGSSFRMIQSGGKPTAGPFVPNGDSTCHDKTWSAMLPGTAGGLTTNAFQPNPQPAFDATKNGLAASITQPTKFFAVSFALSTNATDPQTKGATTVPTIINSGGKLSGDLGAVTAAWNGIYFNQGAPKPDGTRPGNTSGPTGTYDAATHHYTLDWMSQIVGGPFTGFTGVWHLEGTFVAGGK